MALRSKNSAADSICVCFISVTASHADCVVGNSSSAEAEYGNRSAVRIVTDDRNASVPSLPTIKWAMMSNGSSNSTNGSIVKPVTFFI